MEAITIRLTDTDALRAINALGDIVESPYVAIDTRDREALAQLYDRLQDWRVNRLTPDNRAQVARSSWSKEAHELWVQKYRWCRAHHVSLKNYPYAH